MSCAFSNQLTTCLPHIWEHLGVWTHLKWLHALLQCLFRFILSNYCNNSASVSISTPCLQISPHRSNSGRVIPEPKGSKAGLVLLLGCGMRFSYVSPHSFKPAWNLGFLVQELGWRWLHPTHISGAGKHVDILKYGQQFQIKKFLTLIFMWQHVKDGRGWRKAACSWVSQNEVFQDFQMEGKMPSNPLDWLALPSPRTSLAMTWSWKGCQSVVWGESESWGGGGVRMAAVQVCPACSVAVRVSAGQSSSWFVSGERQLCSASEYNQLPRSKHLRPPRIILSSLHSLSMEKGQARSGPGVPVLCHRGALSHGEAQSLGLERAWQILAQPFRPSGQRPPNRTFRNAHSSNKNTNHGSPLHVTCPGQPTGWGCQSGRSCIVNLTGSATESNLPGWFHHKFLTEQALVGSNTLGL